MGTSWRNGTRENNGAYSSPSSSGSSGSSRFTGSASRPFRYRVPDERQRADATRSPSAGRRPRQTEATGDVDWLTATRVRVLRFLFGLLYRNRTLYWLASTIPFAGQWRVWQRLAIPRLVGSDVLEVGCGIGTLLADMVNDGYTCAAVDRSPAMVEATRRELRRRGASLAETPVVQANAQALPFADASFDSVVSTFPTEYIYDPATLDEIGRVLRPQGRLIIVMGARLLPTRLALAPLAIFQSLVYGRRTSQTTGARWNERTRNPMAQALTRAGFVPQVETVRGPFWEAYILMGDKA
ncbi:MAG TPA: class I SAM-dependent methyltransferase [Ktedonobacterales bacterium]|nr:class I SAM-dependent methyltransferase [Ktedonobacterales bacterium]